MKDYDKHYLHQLEKNMLKIPPLLLEEHKIYYLSGNTINIRLFSEKDIDY